MRHVDRCKTRTIRKNPISDLGVHQNSLIISNDVFNKKYILKNELTIYLY